MKVKYIEAQVSTPDSIDDMIFKGRTLAEIVRQITVKKVKPCNIKIEYKTKEIEL